MRSVKEVVLSFHQHYKFDIGNMLEVWESAFDGSDIGELTKSLMDWIKNRPSDYLKAPMPADIRPYYTQRINTKRTAERIGKPTGIYGDIYRSKINFKHVTDDELKLSAGKILAFRQEKNHESKKDGCKMGGIADSIICEYEKRFGMERSAE